MDNRRSIISLQQFPISILTKIVQKTGKASSSDYCNLRATCKIMRQASEKTEVLQSLYLSPLVKKPIRAMLHQRILSKCLYQKNTATFFVEGIITYFVENNLQTDWCVYAMQHLGRATMRFWKLVICMVFCASSTAILYDEMPFMYWREDEEDLVVRVLKNLRKMLHGIPVDKKAVYTQWLRSRRPGRSCHVLDMEIDCSECFMYKRGMKFFYMTQHVPYLH